MSSNASDLFSVKDKIVLVTGGGAGIGLMFTTAYVAAGAKVYISSRNATTISSVAQQLTSTGPGTCTAIAVDLSTVAGISDLVSRLQTDHNITKLHVLVNNSGLTWGEAYEKFKEIGWDKVMNLNVKSLFFLTQQLTPLLIAGGTSTDPSRIINIGSVAGIRHQTFPTYSYDVSKAAVHHLTKKLAADLAQYNITVNAIAPGFVPTKMSQGLKLTSEQLKKIIPLGRVGDANDMGGVALFLSSKASSWMTGVVIPVDGGALVSSKL